MKPQENQLQTTESKYKDKEVVEEEALTKDVEDYVGASTSQHIRHKFETSREK